MKDQMNAFIFVENANVNVFFFNIFERDRKGVIYLRFERERERIRFLN